MNDSNLPSRTSGHTLPEHYNPEQGLKIIASAEAAENYYRRAKDATLLFEAVETKLTEQRNFVYWWDRQEKDKGAAQERRNRSVTALKRSELPVDPMTLSRWRTRLKDDAKFEKAVQSAQERCRRTCEADRGSTEQKGASGTGENEWYTPAEYVEAAREVLGTIDLDPASSKAAQEVIKAKRFYSTDDDGLNHPWNGRIWLNPPYAQPWIALFVHKLVEEISKGHTDSAIMLTHNYTDTSWFHEAAGMCNAICFTRGRVRFLSSDGELAAPTQGQAFFYFGSQSLVFAKRFRAIGFVVEPIEAADEHA